MGITAAAVVIGGGAIATEVITVTVLAEIALAVTVVGVVTKNATLLKIGGGLGLAAGGAGLLKEAGASELAQAGTVTEGATSTNSLAAPTAADLTTAAPAVDSGLASTNSLAAPSADNLTAASLADAGQTTGAGLPSTAGPAPTGSPLTAPSGKNLAAAYDKTLQAPDASTPFGSAAKTPNSDGFIKSILDGLDDRKTMQSAMIVGGQALSGLYQAGAQEDQLAFQKKQYNRRVANANAQPTVNAGVNAGVDLFNTGKSPTYTPPKPVGIINTAQGAK